MSLRTLASQLQQGELSAQALAEQTLRKAQNSDSVYIRLNEGLVDEAVAIDEARANGETLPPLAGIPITLKDLFNIRGEQTLAGSKVLADVAPVETADADVVAPLREAGMLFAGRTNMSEFAFSGMGINAHYGTPCQSGTETGNTFPAALRRAAR